MKPALLSSSMPQSSRNAEVEPHVFKTLILNRPHSSCKHNEEPVPGATGGGSSRLFSGEWALKAEDKDCKMVSPG